jgi:hypothetical protein
MKNDTYDITIATVAPISRITSLKFLQVSEQNVDTDDTTKRHSNSLRRWRNVDTVEIDH